MCACQYSSVGCFDLIFEEKMRVVSLFLCLGGLDTRAAQAVCSSSGAAWCGQGCAFKDS